MKSSEAIQEAISGGDQSQFADMLCKHVNEVGEN